MEKEFIGKRVCVNVAFGSANTGIECATMCVRRIFGKLVKVDENYCMIDCDSMDDTKANYKFYGPQRDKKTGNLLTYPIIINKRYIISIEQVVELN